jgi:hypothetical protein
LEQPTSGAASLSSSYDLSTAVLKVESRAMSKKIRSFKRSDDSMSKGRSSARASNSPYKVAIQHWQLVIHMAIKKNGEMDKSISSEKRNHLMWRNNPHLKKWLC